MAKEHGRVFKEHGKFLATASPENIFDYWVPSKQWEYSWETQCEIWNPYYQ